MKIEDAISIARATERACKDGEEETALQVLADAVIDLRTAAKLCWERRDMVSGSLEMGECDEFCKNLGIEPWAWKYRTGTVGERRMCKCGMPWEPDMDQFGCWSCGAEKPGA